MNNHLDSISSNNEASFKLGLELDEKQIIHCGTEDMSGSKNEKNRKLISFLTSKTNKRADRVE